MNAIKKLFAASLTLAAVTGASAQTTIHILGSTAYRAAAITAIQNILSPGYTYGYIGASVTKANQSTFQGTTKNGSLPVIIECSWTGSVGGVQTLAQSSPVITIATWLTANGTQLSANGTSVTASSAVYDAPVTGDVTMSDSFQGSTLFSGGNYLNLNDTKVGVVPFVWVKGSSNDSGVAASLQNLTNITPLQAKAILGAGSVPLSVLTGNASDSSIDVLAVGRDEDSGTRLDAFAETGFGIFSAPLQQQATVGGSNTITAITPYPANTVDGIPYTTLGHSGYSSGGTLAGVLNDPVDSAARDGFNNKFALVGYFGTSDAGSVNSGNNNLMYNGVPYSAANIQEGKYTFWSYEHLMYRQTLSGTAKTVADQIAQQILTQDAVQAGLLISSMHVSRTVEGGVITHN